MDTDKWFDRLPKDAKRAQEALNNKRYAEFHYFAGCIVGDVRVLIELAGIKEQEETKTLEG